MKMGGLRAAGRAQYLSSGKKSVLKGSAVDDGWVASSGGGGRREAVSTADAWMSGRTAYSYAAYSESAGGDVLFISRYSYIMPLSMTRMQF